MKFLHGAGMEISEECRMANYSNGSVEDAITGNWEQIRETVAWAVKSALVKRGRFAVLQADGEETRRELEDSVSEKVVRAIRLSWKPNGGASPATFASTTAKFAALKAVDALAAHQSRFGTSLDAPVNSDGGDDGSDDRTLADTMNDETAPGSLHGAAKIRVETDLSLIRDILSREDFAVFIRRYGAKVSNRELAAELGWTEDRLRWFLRGYQKRLSRLFGIQPPQSLISSPSSRPNHHPQAQCCGDMV